MAVVEFDRDDFEKLLGKRPSDADYRGVLPMIGAPLERLDRDVVQFEIFPNRPDMLSVEGFARAVRSFLDIETGLKKYNIGKGRSVLRVDGSVTAVRPYIAAAIARDVKLTDNLIRSLMQIQEKIHDTFGRKRRKVSIGIHDADKVEQPFTYKAVSPAGVSFVPLEGKKQMTPAQILKEHPKGNEFAWILDGCNNYPLLTDSKGRVLSFPPIINGELTKLTGKTRNVLIEVTGTSQHAVGQALNILVALLADRGCSIESVLINGKAWPDMEPSAMKINIDYVNKLLDTDLKNGEIRVFLEKMGMGYKNGSVLVPAYRTDVMHPIDIVEDVAIAMGYQKFEPRIPKIPAIAREDRLERLNENARDIMVGAGFQEVITFILTNKAMQFDMMGMQAEPVAEILNPKTGDYTIARKYIMQNLLDVLSKNKNRDYPQRIFETGDCVVPDAKAETGTRYVKKLSAAVSHARANVNEIKSVLETFMKNMGTRYSIEPRSHPSFIEGRCGAIVAGKNDIAIFGEIHPNVLEKFGLDMPVAMFETLLE